MGDPSNFSETWGVSSFEGWHHWLWILNVDAQRFVVDASHAPDASDRVRAEVLQIVNSIEIQP